jgi:ribosomal protein S18 acetylase RimI-like enzyme
VTIRLASLDDEGDAVLEVLRAGYAVEARLVGYPELPGLRASVDDLRGEDVWLAEIDGSIAGVLGLEDGDELLIARLVVAPAFARRGLGRALVRHAVGLAGPGRAVLVGTAAENAPALALYEALGFARTTEGVVGRGLRYVWLRREPG